MAKPDKAVILAGVVTQAAVASKALATNNAAVRKLFKVLSEFGLATSDVKTHSFSVSPRFKRRTKGGGVQAIVGYRVVNQVTVTVRDLDLLGHLLDDMIKVSVNRLNSIRFLVDERETFEDQARSKAMADARRKATLLAASAGAKIGRVLNITEGGVEGPRPRMLRAEQMASVPIAPGEQKVTASVIVTYLLE